MLNDICYKLSQAQDILRVAQDNETARASLINAAKDVLRATVKLLDSMDAPEDDE